MDSLKRAVFFGRRLFARRAPKRFARPSGLPFKGRGPLHCPR
jgi:hypothetical protein